MLCKISVSEKRGKAGRREWREGRRITVRCVLALCAGRRCRNLLPPRPPGAGAAWGDSRAQRRGGERFRLVSRPELILSATQSRTGEEDLLFHGHDTRSFTHSLTHLLTHHSSLTYSLTHSLLSNSWRASLWSLLRSSRCSRARVRSASLSSASDGVARGASPTHSLTHSLLDL